MFGPFYFARHHLAVATVLVFAAASLASGQEAPATTPAASVDSFVERALSRAPSLAARRERITASRSAAQAAGALPDPMIEFQYQSFNFPRYTIGSDPNSMAGASIRQGLLSGGRRTAARALAQAEIGERAAAQRLQAADIAMEVRLDYARLYAIDREAETLRDAAQLVRMLEATASSRYAAGSADQASVLRVQLEQSRIAQRVADLATERTTVQAALNRLTNDPPDAPIGLIASLPPAALPPGAASPDDQAIRQAPGVAVHQSELDVASRQVQAARAELSPTWTVGGGIFWQGGLDRMVNFSVGLELPLWKKRKQLPLISAAEGEQRAAQFEMTNAATEVRAEAARLVAEYQNAIAQIVRYHEALLPQNSAALDATRASYLGGRGDFASVLEEFRRWIDLRTELAGREADRYSAQARLEALFVAPQVGAAD